MSQDLGLEEQIDMMMISIQRNMIVSILYSGAIFLLQGVIIVLFSFLFDGEIISLLLLVLGVLITLFALSVLILNFRYAVNSLHHLSVLEEELPTPPENDNNGK
jgi:hypothetical protein